jgi:ABC-type polysaccharide/polyol phosphate export permease
MVSYQEMLFAGTFRHHRGLALAGVAAVIVFAIGAWLFERLRDTLAEEV